jgi:rhomboid protease GluP
MTRGGATRGAVAVDLSRGLELAAGWVLFLGAFGVMPFLPAEIAALCFLVLARQLQSGNVLRTAPLTFALVGAMVATYGVVWLRGGDEGVSHFASAGAVSLPGVMRGEVWRIPATVFLHGSWDHLYSNFTWILGLGLLLEPAIGTWALAQACVLTLMVSTALELPFSVGSFGASGVVYGLEGVFLARPLVLAKGGRRRLSWAWLLAAWLILSDLPNSQYTPGIGFAAHLGGLISGLWFGCIRTERKSAVARHSPQRLRWIVAGALATCLIAAEALNPRWPLDWDARIASHAEKAGDLSAAAHMWTAIEAVADPLDPLDARKLDRAARYWARRNDIPHAIRIMSQVSPTLGADEYDDLGAFQAYSKPLDERGALESWEQSLALDPARLDVLDRIAHLRLFPTDSTLYSPAAAYYLAKAAVAQDSSQTPELLRTFAEAQDRCGRRDEAIATMRAALKLDPEARAEFEKELAAMEHEPRPAAEARDSIAVALEE